MFVVKRPELDMVVNRRAVLFFVKIYVIAVVVSDVACFQEQVAVLIICDVLPDFIVTCCNRSVEICRIDVNYAVDLQNVRKE